MCGMVLLISLALCGKGGPMGEYNRAKRVERGVFTQKKSTQYGHFKILIFKHATPLFSRDAPPPGAKPYKMH